MITASDEMKVPVMTVPEIKASVIKAPEIRTTEMKAILWMGHSYPYMVF